MPKISIIIPTYNHLEDCLIPCLESIIENTDLNDIEVIVVANGCKDGTREYVESLGDPFKLIWFDEALGYTKSTNIGIKAAQGEYVLLFNNDCRILNFWPKHEWILDLLRPLQNDEKVAITGVVEEYDPITNERFLIFFCAMIRKSVFDELGLLDESFSPGCGEDTSFCIEARKHGYKTILLDSCKSGFRNYDMQSWVSDFPIYHVGEQTFNDFNSEEHQYNLNKNINILREKHPIMPKFSLVIPTYNNLEYLQSCLESIVRNTRPNEFEVIVVASNCQPETKQYVNSLGSLFKIIQTDRLLNYSEAFNEGIKLCHGDYISLLQENIVFLDVDMNGKTWHEQLLDLFVDSNIGIAGPIVADFYGIGRYYISFDFVTIKREVIDKIGLLDESFGWGGLENVEYCYRCQEAGLELRQFDSPIWQNSNYVREINSKQYKINKKSIKNKYLLNNEYQLVSYLRNNWERDVASRNYPLNPFVAYRYNWAKENIVGNKILEIGCSSGYGALFFEGIENLDYLGIDYDEEIIEFAQQQYGDISGVKFQHADINDFQLGYYDTIISMENIEHIPDGLAIVEKLKKHCDNLLITVPYDNDPPEWVDIAHHKLFNLTEKHFPGFESNMIVHDPGGQTLYLKWREPKIKVSIVIPTYNHLEDCLKPCLESIKHNTNLENIEVIVVANGCKDGTREYVESLGSSFKLLWFDEALGYTKSTNIGIKAAQGEYVLLLNNDCAIADYWEKNRWIETLLSPFDDPQIGITGAKTLHCYEIDRDFLVFFCVMFKKSMIDIVGLLDEAFSPGFGEDIDFCVKVQNAGYKMYEVTHWTDDNHVCGDFPIYHAAEATVHGLSNWEEIKTRNNATLRNRYNNTIKYSVIIPTYNHLEDCLKPCIESVIKYTNLENIEIIIAANGCTDGTREYVESLGSPFKLLWFDEAIGFIKSTNAAVNIAKGEFLILLNNDTVLLPQDKNNWINILKAPFDNNSNIGATGPEGNIWEYSVHPLLFFWCVMIPRDIYNQLGGLDECYGLGGSDDGDFCIRLEEAGYIPKIVPTESGNNFPIWHRAHVTFGQSLHFQSAWKNVNQKIFNEKYRYRLEKEPLPEGFFNMDDILVYKKIFGMLPDNSIVAELGTWKGRSICSVGDLIVSKKISVVAVDTFEGTVSEQDTWHVDAKIQDIKSIFIDNIKAHNLQGYVGICHNTTDNACKTFKDKTFDMVFIDADHSYDAVKNDIKKWYPKVKAGGIIAGHDCLHPPVIQALYEEFGDKFICENNVWYCRKPYIYDCFPFFNELDILELRLNELSEVVDKFVITEATLTHSGKPKLMYFQDNKKRFEKFLPQIIHVIVDFPETEDNWVRERYQRDAAMQSLTHLQDDDIVLMSDADEIPNAAAVANYRQHHGVCAFTHMMHYYFLDYITHDELWTWGRILPYSELKNRSLCEIRYLNQQFELPNIPDGGWHFSFLGGINGIKQKLESYAHQEYNTDYFKDRNRLIDIIKNNKSILDRDCKYEKTQIDDRYPIYLRENIGKFKHLLFDSIYNQPKISIIIPTYNHLEDCLQPCIESITKNTNLENIEVVVVANGCTDNTKKYIESLGEPFKLVWFDSPLGYIKSVNEGVRKSMGDYIVLLNNDTIIAAGNWIDLLLKPFESDNLVGITGAQKLLDSFTNWEFFVFFCVMIKREVFDKIGLLDESFGLGYCEDTDFCIKAQKAGYKLCQVPNDEIDVAKQIFPIQHVSNRTFSDLANNHELLANNRKMIIERYNKNKEETIEFSTKEVIKSDVKNTVTAVISTKDRYFTTLPLAITSIINQTVLPKKIIIFDDGEQKDLREELLYKNIFATLEKKGIEIFVAFGDKKGQVLNHQKSIEMTDTEWIWRIDDDNFMEPDVLEKLLSVATDDVGAVGGLVLDPKNPFEESNVASNKIEDIYLGMNKQWFKHTNVNEVDHLYSTFIYRKRAASHGYCMELSPVGHREETIFTYEMKRNGWKLLINPAAITWHYRNNTGGIRSYDDANLWAHDEEVFKHKLNQWKAIPGRHKLIILNNGLGDHYAFKHILPEIKNKFADEKVIIAVCYPEVFEDDNLKLISIAEAKMLTNKFDAYDIYRWMWERNWNKSLVEAFKGMYL